MENVQNDHVDRLGDSARATLAASGFVGAETYDAGRPRYCADAVHFLVNGLAITSEDCVLDLGAGTGKFTSELVATGARVIAVEPSPTMRSSLARALPSVTVLDGTGEAVPLTDATCDAVVVAQAFHWFQPTAALTEIERVLTTTGRLGLVWNERDESVDWVHALSIAMQWTTRQPYIVGTNFADVVRAHSSFAFIRRERFRFVDDMNLERLRQRVLSTSYIAAADDDERRNIMSDVDLVLAQLPREVALPYIADTYVCSRTTLETP